MKMGSRLRGLGVARWQRREGAGREGIPVGAERGSRAVRRGLATNRHDCIVAVVAKAAHLLKVGTALFGERRSRRRLHHQIAELGEAVQRLEGPQLGTTAAD